MEKIKCPVCMGRKNKIPCVACNGSGVVELPKKKLSKIDKDGRFKEAAHKLRDAGYTLREIAAMLGYKGAQSIAHLLNKKPLQ